LFDLAHQGSLESSKHNFKSHERFPVWVNSSYFVVWTLLDTFTSKYADNMKLFIALTFLISCVISSNAQVAVRWQNTIGGNNLDYLNPIEPTSDGGYICGGFSNSNISGDKTENSNGDFDLWIIKLDQFGIIQWQNTIGGSSYENIRSITQTSDGGYICGATSRSNASGDKTENSLGGDDFWVIKLDSAGNILWQNTIGGDDNDILHSVVPTSDGGFICGGYSRSGISGDKTENSIGLDDYWIVKLDSVGNIQWQNTIGGTSVDNLFSISQTFDGGYICGGTSNSNISGDKTENSQGVFDYWVVKLDPNGNIMWQNTIGGSDAENLRSITQTPDGGYICGGHSTSNISGDKTENCLGFSDYWIVKLDDVGNIQWQNTIGGSSPDNLSTIILTADGGYLCGGYSYSSISGDKSEHCIGNADYWVVKLDSTGNIQWQNTIGGTGEDQLNSIRLTSDGGIICGGSSGSPISGDKNEPNMGLSDIWVMKLVFDFNEISGIAYADFNSNNILDAGEPILPNKMMGELQTGSITFTKPNGKYSVAVFDTGSFTVLPISTIQHFSASPANHSASFTSLNQTDSLNDFAFQPVGVVNDLMITLTPISPFRIAFSGQYLINYQNIGNTSLTGTIVLYTDSVLSFLSSTSPPFSITADSIVWQTPILNPFETGSFTVRFQVPAWVALGSQINSCAVIEPISGDVDPTNNQDCSVVTVTGSYDPNDILVDRATLFTTELINPPYLDYIIRFQNTGTDTAFTVKILNPIDTTKLQLQTFEFVASSHPADITWKSWERNMEFQFENILLPDSNVNEPESHGFIRYRIKPKSTLSLNDTIKNNAFIYFDFNAPVATNTANTVIVLSTGISSFDNVFEFNIYPNPVTSDLYLDLNLAVAGDADISVMSIEGKLIARQTQTLSAGQNRMRLLTNYLDNGVYFVKVKAGGVMMVKKFVKM
jgi:hypothetical protein